MRSPTDYVDRIPNRRLLVVRSCPTFRPASGSRRRLPHLSGPAASDPSRWRASAKWSSIAGDFSKLTISRQNIANASRGWSKWPKPNCSVYTPDDRNPATILPRRFPTQRRASGWAPGTFPPPPLAFPHSEDVLSGLGNHGLVLGQKFPLSHLKPKGDLLVFCLPQQAVRAPSGPGGDWRRRCPTPARTHLAPWRIWL